MLTLEFPEAFASLIFPVTEHARLANQAFRNVMSMMHNIHLYAPSMFDNMDLAEYTEAVYMSTIHQIMALGKTYSLLDAKDILGDVITENADWMELLTNQAVLKTLHMAGIKAPLFVNGTKTSDELQITNAASENEEAPAVPNIDDLPDEPTEEVTPRKKRKATKSYTRAYKRGLGFNRIPDGKRLDNRQRENCYIVCYDASLQSPVKVYPAKQLMNGKANTDHNDEYIREVIRKYHTETGCAWTDIRLVSKAWWNNIALVKLYSRWGKSAITKYLRMK